MFRSNVDLFQMGSEDNIKSQLLQENIVDKTFMDHDSEVISMCTC